MIGFFITFSNVSNNLEKAIEMNINNESGWLFDNPQTNANHYITKEPLINTFLPFFKMSSKA